jgi:hypothetical protein
MKTKELIKRLQEEDPSGEIEVCVGNVDIHFVERMPAYYDGSLQVLIRDYNTKYYNIVGGKYVREGQKVKIHILSITDAISNAASVDANFEVDYSQLSEESAKSTQKAHADLREWHRKLDIEHEKEYFLKWVKQEAAKVTADTDEINNVVYSFFEKNVSPTNPLPEGGVPLGHSYVTTREMQWGQKFEVVVSEGFLKIVKKEI